MLVQRHLLARTAVEVLAVRAAFDGVAIPKHIPLDELGQQEIDDVLEGVGEERVCL